jgi:TatA/E family protein of Tat protein translocase
MFGVSFNELLIVLGVALLILGPDKLPELARSLGKGLNELKRATDDITHSLMADTGLKETAESLKKSLLTDTGLGKTAESLKKSLNIDTGMSRTDLRKMFEDIEQGTGRPAQPPEGLATPEGPSQTAESGASAEKAAAPAATDAATTPEAKPAPVKTAAKFADDDAD